MLGRVDSTVNLGKFFNLKLLMDGDLIHVTFVDGVVTTFVVILGLTRRDVARPRDRGVRPTADLSPSPIARRVSARPR